MYIKLDYLYFSAFALEVKVIEISKYILPFSGKSMIKSKRKTTKF